MKRRLLLLLAAFLLSMSAAVPARAAEGPFPAEPNGKESIPEQIQPPELQSDAVSEETVPLALAGVGTADRIHFLSLRDLYAASDAILIESNGHFGLIDASHPSSDPDIALNRTTVDVDDVIAYLRSVGVTHLDFVIGTHSHSDHIGGMKFLAEAKNSQNKYFIDSSTVYYYKKYYYNQVEEGKWKWHNTRLYNKALTAMKGRGAILVECSAHDKTALQKAGAAFQKGGADSVSDSLVFKLGDFSITLLNLYTVSEENENQNSIVAVISKDGKEALSMADIERKDNLEKRIVNTVVSRFGTVDVFMLGHHGYETSTSYETLVRLSPSYGVIQTNQYWEPTVKDNTPFNSFFQYRGIPLYRTCEQKNAVVADFSQKEIELVTYDKSGKLGAKPLNWDASWEPGWKTWPRDEETEDYVYIGSNGRAVKGWKYLDHDGKEGWYFFNSDGVMARGWAADGGKWYYLKNSGRMAVGWREIDGKWYLLHPKSGEMLTGWQKSGNAWYWLDTKSGAMRTGWASVEGRWFYLGTDGRMQTGWIRQDGKWYYLVPGSGAAQTGWGKVNGIWYYFAPGSAEMKTGWVNTGDRWYYLAGSGAMKTGWLQQDGKWYYLVPGSGAAQTGWKQIGDIWYFFDRQSAAMRTGWILDEDIWYYLGSSGAMQTGWKQIAGVWYYFQEDGAMAADMWVDEYYLTSDGSMAVSTQIGEYSVGPDGRRLPPAQTGPETEGTMPDAGEILPGT